MIIFNLYTINGLSVITYNGLVYKVLPYGIIVYRHKREKVKLSLCKS